MEKEIFASQISGGTFQDSGLRLLPCKKNTKCVCASRRPPKCVKEYDNLESTGTEVMYRCVDCRECLKCNNGPRMDFLSITEEIEETLITESLTVDLDWDISSSRLPFVVDPDGRISRGVLARKYLPGKVQHRGGISIKGEGPPINTMSRL